MKIFYIFIITLFTIGCQKKTVQLPQVDNIDITQITDYSPIYIFFDEKTNEAELNRSNLITSTHWIFHVDKRNSLYQSALQIEKMQTRKENPMNPHNNPSSLNYFSVAKISENQLGFIDFSLTRFHFFAPENLNSNLPQIWVKKEGFFIDDKKISFSEFSQNQNKSYLWIFDGSMSFQDFMNFYVNLLENNYIPKKIIYTKP